MATCGGMPQMDGAIRGARGKIGALWRPGQRQDEPEVLASGEEPAYWA